MGYSSLPTHSELVQVQALQTVDERDLRKSDSKKELCFPSARRHYHGLRYAFRFEDD
jgi:hypothetical protein